jgi:hypothetical protein
MVEVYGTGYGAWLMHGLVQVVGAWLMHGLVQVLVDALVVVQVVG